MAQVRAFDVGGIEMIFYSGDHEPPHFHASRRGEWHARVFIQADRDEMIELIRPPDAKIRGSDRRAIVKGVEENRVALLAEWESCQGDP